jgi:hypothetical protein
MTGRRAGEGSKGETAEASFSEASEPGAGKSFDIIPKYSALTKANESTSFETFVPFLQA